MKFLVSWAHFILSYFATYIGAARRAGPFDVLREIQTCFIYIQIWRGRNKESKEVKIVGKQRKNSF